MKRISSEEGDATYSDDAVTDDIISLRAAIEAKLKQRRCVERFHEYVMETSSFPGFEFKNTKVGKYICDKVQEFLERESENAYDILCLSMPPQHGKSAHITESLPSWYLQKNPMSSTIVASYNEEFCSGFGRKNLQKIIDRGGEIFPDFRLATAPCTSVVFGAANGRGECKFTGILGGITGKPANLIIIDDPIKNFQESMSETTRNGIIHEWISSVKTRLAAKAKIIVIMTRWHDADLVGYISKTERNVEVINIPCECEDEANDPLGRRLGDALLPELGKGNTWLASFKEAYLNGDLDDEQGGLTAWTSLFQGRPSLAGGNIFKRDWFREFDPSDNIEYGMKVVSVDATFKDANNSDYVTIGIWAKRGRDFFLLDMIKRRMDFVDTLNAIRSVLKQNSDVWYTLIEDKANGSAIISSLQDEFGTIVPIQPDGGKVARANSIQGMVESGHVYLNKYAAWRDDFIKECCDFPKGRHDDQVDNMTQVLNYLKSTCAEVNAKPVDTIKNIWTEDMHEDYRSASESVRAKLIKIWGEPV